MSSVLRVTVVCSGNICRSPIGEVVLRDAVERAGLGDSVVVDSAGIGAWHVGDGADPRAVAVLAAHGYDGSTHEVQQITRAWFTEATDARPAPDLLLAMDVGHHDALRRLAPDTDVRMYRSFDPTPAGSSIDGTDLDVPDPYYGKLSDFDEVLALIKVATPGVVAHLRSLLT